MSLLECQLTLGKLKNVQYVNIYERSQNCTACFRVKCPCTGLAPVSLRTSPSEKYIEELCTVSIKTKLHVPLINLHLLFFFPLD